MSSTVRIGHRRVEGLQQWLFKARLMVSASPSFRPHLRLSGLQRFAMELILFRRFPFPDASWVFAFSYWRTLVGTLYDMRRCGKFLELGVA
jgi:hypothetical protein